MNSLTSVTYFIDCCDEAESGGDAEGAFREQLQCLKHKTHALVHSGGSPISGSLASSCSGDVSGRVSKKCLWGGV